MVGNTLGGADALGSSLWPMIGGIVGIATLAIIVYVYFVRPRVEAGRTRKLAALVEMLRREPCEVHFLIPDRQRRDLSYVGQDDREHLVDTLVLPSNSTLPIELWMKPLINFHQNELYFGCEGELTVKPAAIEYFNPFIDRGLARQAAPETHADHYVDHHRYYHIMRQADRVTNQVYVTGFLLKTTAPGDYEAQLFFGTPEVLGRAKLTIRVEESPATRMICTSHDSCSLRPNRRVGEVKRNPPDGHQES